jgi:phage shock protein A
MTQVQYSNQALSDTQITSYREHARKALSSGYNLFAEITLRVIASHEALALELMALRRQWADREIETEFVARENEDLRARIVELEQEQRRLQSDARQQQKEISRLKRSRIDLPPSWG